MINSCHFELSIEQWSALFFRFMPGGVLPYISHKGMPAHRVGVFRRFGLKTGINFAHFGLESGMVFEGTTGVYERIYRFNFK